MSEMRLRSELRRVRLLEWAVAIPVLIPFCGCTEPANDLVLVGTVERTFVELVAPVAETLVAVPVHREQAVEAGATVAELDPTLAAADLASAEAVLASARASLSMAQDEAQRSRKLRSDGVISQQQFDRAKLALDEARARQREAQARREAAAKRLRDHTLHAPVTGVVDQLPFEAGERVPAGAVLAVISDDSDPWVRVWIPAPAVSRVARDAPARVRIDGLPALSGRVTEIAREPEYTPHFALTERERGYLVFEGRVRIENAPATLRAGVPAEVTLALRAATPTPEPGATPGAAAAERSR